MQGSAAPARPSRPCAQAFRRSSPPAGTQSALFLPHFCHGFPTVAGMAEALQVAAVCEHRPVSTVRLDVIHLRGRWPSAVPGTLTAKRPSTELAGPQVLRPLRGKVHPVPGLGRGAASVLWAVEITVAVGDQGSTSRMPAGAQRLVSHGLSPPDKIKTPEPMTKPAMGDHGLRRSTLRPLAISRMISVLQSLQYTGRPVASVSSSIRSSL